MDIAIKFHPENFLSLSLAKIGLKTFNTSHPLFLRSYFEFFLLIYIYIYQKLKTYKFKKFLKIGSSVSSNDSKKNWTTTEKNRLVKIYAFDRDSMRGWLLLSENYTIFEWKHTWNSYNEYLYDIEIDNWQFYVALFILWYSSSIRNRKYEINATRSTFIRDDNQSDCINLLTVSTCANYMQTLNARANNALNYHK